MNLLLIAVGGAAGALLRYGVSEWVTAPRGGFPLATLLANVTGAFLLGVASLLLVRLEVSAAVRLGLTVGVLGAYTTFSTFSVETLELISDGEWRTAALYVVASVAGALAAAWAGQSLARATG
ncbi:MAG: fluoride efflux transporter CrcB [Chloroflexi bacterium]|nr:fluoride efflux transporter CrcB [Chloroflexota bacterium]MYE45979.1 fluoride efflux transporter CrcB [Chloroflexota bacterium]